MGYTLSINGDTGTGEDPPEQTFYTEDAPSVSLSFPGEDGTGEYRCADCGETTEDEPVTDYRAHVDPESLCTETECTTCYGAGERQGTDSATGDIADVECTDCAGTGHGMHRWEREAHAWLNSARIDASDPDRVTVLISVGSPLGAFAMSVERITYTPDGSDTEVTELRLSLPSPADSMAHMGLVPLGSHGYFRIVATESPEHVAARKTAIERV